MIELVLMLLLVPDNYTVISPSWDGNKTIWVVNVTAPSKKWEEPKIIVKRERIKIKINSRYKYDFDKIYF